LVSFITFLPIPALCKAGKPVISATLLLLIFGRSASLLCQIGQPGAILPKPPLIRKAQLLNGLRLVTVQTQGASRIALNLLVKAGSTMDLPNKGGTAYLVAHGLRFANGHEALEHLNEEMDDLGAKLEIHVSQDSTIFKAEVPPHSLESFLDLLGRMVLRPLFQLERVEKLKQQVIASNIESPDPGELAKEKLHGLIFGKHPYARTTYGELQSIGVVGPQDLDEFHKRYYCPNNAAVIIVGALEASQIGKLIREKLGGWVKGAKVEREFPEAPIKQTFSMLVVKNASEEVAMTFGHTGPPRATPDYQALTAMNLILGGLGDRSRLADYFRAKGIAYRILKSEFQFGYWGGSFQVTSLIPTKFVAPALFAVLQAIEALKNSPVKESELAAAKEQLLGEYAEILNSPFLIADQVTCMELYDLASDFLASFPKRVQEVTRERVEEVSKNYLSTSRAAAVFVGTCDSSIPELRKLGTVEIIEESGGRRQK